MSQMPQLPRLTACPSCAEPLESGDNFCGGCGVDVSTAAPPPTAPAPRAGTGGTGTAGANGTAPGAAADGGPDPAGAAGPTAARPGAAPGPVPAPAAGDTAPAADGFAGPARRTPDPAAGTAGTTPPADGGTLHLGPVSPAPAGPAAAAGPAGPVPPPPVAQPLPDPAAPRAGAEEPEDYPLPAPAPPGSVPAAADPRAALGEPEPAAPPAAAPQAGGPAPGAGPGAVRSCASCRAGLIDKDGYCENCGHAQPRERDHMEYEVTGVAAASDRGLRHHRNEDAFTVSAAALPDGSPAAVAVVCDGVSSATRPDDASAAAAATAGSTLVEALPRGTHPQQAMREAIVAAAEAVDALAREPVERPHDHHRQENSPACTIVGAVVAGGILTVGWVGDSRAYWVPDDRTTPAARLTEDDSWAAQMVAAGLMSEEEAYADERAHAITGWLGADAYELDPHTASFKPDRPGVVVVCTDGLWNYAESAAEMAVAVPPDARSRPLHSARVLVDHALDGGGHDNVTVAVLPFPAPAGGAVSA